MAKAKKIEDLKGKTVDELHKLLLDTRKEQFNLRFQRSGGQLANTSEVRKARRNIARIKTALTVTRGPVAAKKAAPKAAKSAATPKAKKTAAPKKAK